MGIIVIDMDGKDRRRVTSDAADDTEPAWSEDGQRLAFASDRSGVWDVYEIRARNGRFRERDARAIADRVLAIEHYPAWAPQGRGLVISSNYFGDHRNIVRIHSSDKRTYEKLTDSPTMTSTRRIRRTVGASSSTGATRTFAPTRASGPATSTP